MNRDKFFHVNVNQESVIEMIRQRVLFNGWQVEVMPPLPDDEDQDTLLLASLPIPAETFVPPKHDGEVEFMSEEWFEYEDEFERRVLEGLADAWCSGAGTDFMA